MTEKVRNPYDRRTLTGRCLAAQPGLEQIRNAVASAYHAMELERAAAMVAARRKVTYPIPYASEGGASHV